MALRNIIGHERPVRILSGTIKRDRVPSSMLLSGDSGIGKMLAARSYAKALNCLSPIDFDACDECSSCRKIESGSHPDITCVLPENDEIKIESVRQAEEVLSLKPYEGRLKVLIMDDADMMNINAANAFLKTLEEPPGDSLIILISSNPDRLPDTIRSRCMHIRFRPLSGEACKQVLLTKAGGKDIGGFKGLAMGRPGIAITKDFAAEQKWFMDILNTISRGETRCSWTDKNDIKKWLDLCTIWLRDIAVFASTGRESDLLYSGKHTARNVSAALDAYQRIRKVRGLIDLNLNKSITWNFVSGIIQDIVAQPVSGGRSSKAVSEY